LERRRRTGAETGEEKHSDADEEVSLPGTVGPPCTWPYSSLTRSEDEQSEKTFTASNGYGRKWNSEVTVHAKMNEEDETPRRSPWEAE
jgi:hypothetical protein